MNGGIPLNYEIHENINYDSPLFENYTEINSEAKEIAMKEEQLVKEESTDYEDNDFIEIKIGDNNKK